MAADVDNYLQQLVRQAHAWEEKRRRDETALQEKDKRIKALETKLAVYEWLTAGGLIISMAVVVYKLG